MIAATGYFLTSAHIDNDWSELEEDSQTRTLETKSYEEQLKELSILNLQKTKWRCSFPFDFLQRKEWTCPLTCLGGQVKKQRVETTGK